jgi:hypothetical protein
MIECPFISIQLIHLNIDRLKENGDDNKKKKQDILFSLIYESQNIVI